MVLNTIICLVRKVNLKLFVIYWMTEQNLVKYTTIMERHINYYKNLNLTVWNILRCVLHLFFKQDNKDCIQGDKRNRLLKVVQVNQSKPSKTFLKKKNKQTNKQKQEQAGAVIFFGINNNQPFFEIWFEVYIVLPCSLLQTSQHQYLLANWSFHFDIKKTKF